jgi:hypothetical protein
MFINSSQGMVGYNHSDDMVIRGLSHPSDIYKYSTKQDSQKKKLKIMDGIKIPATEMSLMY